MRVLKFFATWCGPCGVLTEEIEKADLPFEVEEVDFDQEVDLAKMYVVKSLPTVVFLDDDGKVIKKLAKTPVRSVTVESIKEAYDQLREKGY